MKKNILVIMCIFLCSVLFAEEALWVTTEDISVWKDGIGTKTFPKGTKVLLNNYYALSKYIATDRDGGIEYVRSAYTTGIIVDDETYGIEVKNIVPIDTPDLFDESFLTVAHYPHRYLLPSYFADVLKSGTRSTMEKYEKELIEVLGDGYENDLEYIPPWWSRDLEIAEESVISQSVIRIKPFFEFHVKRIEKISNGYKVDVKRSEVAFNNSFFPSDRLEYPLFFQFDGDYVDIYIDNLSNKVLSLTYVSPDFYEGVQTVIYDDVAVDLSNLIWPRRADGSSDYDNNIVPRQELPQIDRDPLQDMHLVVGVTTTVEEVKEALETTSMSLLDNASVLTTAISNNANIELIKFLIESGAKIDNSILATVAMYSDDIELYKFIIEVGGVDMNYKYDTPLDTAIRNNRSFEIIELLIESGAKVNGNTLFYAGSHSANIEIYKLLIELGADINQSNENRQTALISAVEQKNPSLEDIMFLLESGASTAINAIDYSGQTALLWALGSSPEITSVLLNAGASLTISVDNRDRSETKGMNILEISQKYNYPYASDILPNLIEMGWEENSNDKIIWQQSGKTYRTTDNLRLRAEEGVLGEPLFTLPKDTPVHIQSIGSIDKIDDIFAYWVEVAVVEDTIDTQGIEVKKGAVGWCFGGYVATSAEDIVYEALPVVAEVSPEKANESLPELESTEESATTQAIPITVWVIGGGVLLLGAIGVVVIVARKKKK